MVNQQSYKEQIDKLAKIIEETNKNFGSENQTFGKCEWVDLDGNERCNSPWSEFQCQQVAGVFTPDESCD
ncbi:MAG TPA: hypothetical protein VIL74_07290 [Pyrinomonadaceae bacterium]|jgi:hypothetical protein